MISAMICFRKLHNLTLISFRKFLHNLTLMSFSRCLHNLTMMLFRTPSIIFPWSHSGNSYTLLPWSRSQIHTVHNLTMISFTIYHTILPWSHSGNLCSILPWFNSGVLTQSYHDLFHESFQVPYTYVWFLLISTCVYELDVRWRKVYDCPNEPLCPFWWWQTSKGTGSIPSH